ncbi:MAG: metal-dependent hydrolase [Bombilactobacillus mellifer]|nr:metal-dependent hydrolase [Bombilactobacillus mellifer]
MKITYFGHAAFQIKLDNGCTILFDPFISQNPFTKTEVKMLNPNYIVLTHAHYDHLGDAIAIAHQSNATIVAQTDFANVLATTEKVKVYPNLNFGGTFNGPNFKLKLYPAWHTDAMNYQGIPLPMGVAAGFALMAEGKLLYDAGDTGLFTDLKLVARKQPVDLAFLPIGGSFTMDAEDAAVAAEFLQARKVIPIHYNTFPAIKADPKAFIKSLKSGVGELPKVDQEFQF